MAASSKHMPADHEARERAATDLDTCFLVEAAAGTGKTTLLLDRIMALVSRGRASLSEIAAITFTEKAAGELKVRLRQMIERALRSAPPEARPALRGALAELEGMTVSTIHRFCAELIRERPVEAGVAPEFSVCDELESSLIFEDVWDQWLAGQMSRDNAALRRAIEFGIAYEAHPRGGMSLPALAKLLVDNRDLLSLVGLAPRRSDEDLAQLADAIRSAIGALVERCNTDCRNAGEDKGARKISELRAWSDRLDGASLDAVLMWLRDAPSINPSLGKQANWYSKAALAGAKTAAREVKTLIESARAEAHHRVICDLVELVRPFIVRYEKAKVQRRRLDFADLLIVAREMLAQSRAARDHFKRAYRYILVDEFQDTDPLQAEIVFFLCERPGEHARNGESVKLQPGKLFMVGDPKQSIYRFRRADLDLYGKVKEMISRQGEVINLRVNFRTVPQILQEANAIFEPLMTGPVHGRFEPEHVALVPHRESVGEQAGVFCLCPPADLDTGELKGVDWRKKESGCIAAYVRDVVARGVKYRDIAILYRHTSGLLQLEEALRAHDVPYQVAGGRHYYSRLEFQHLLAVLSAVANPYDAVSVLGALRSPFFGQSDEDILAHFASGGDFNYLHPVPPESRALADAFEVLRKLHELTTTEPPPALLTELFERTQALQIYAMKPHGEQRVANLLKVQDMARALVESGVSSFGGLVRRLAQMESRRQAEEESPVAEADDDCVRLMTFHSAKGLEFPLVILAHLGVKDTRSESHVFDRTNRRFALNFGNSKKTIDWADALEVEKDRQTDGGFLRHLNGRYPPSEDFRADCANTGARLMATDAFDIDKKRNDDFTLKPKLGDSLPQIARAFWDHRTNWKASLDEQACRLNTAREIATATKELSEMSQGAWQRPPEKVGESDAARFGTLVHRVLEAAEFSAKADVIQRLAEAIARNQGLSPNDAATAARIVLRTLEHPLLKQRAVAASEAYTEVPFTVNYGSALLEGTVDLVFIEDDGAVIVDYKTNNVSPEEASAEAERYRPQAELYARAMQIALGMPVKETIFFFARAGVAVSIPCNAE